jgi:phosphatidylserine/phosphatidylglycerophosphate/cardiolipin synthase-like enzyme
MFNPWFKRGTARSHRKIAVIDRALAFVGGINVNDDLLHDYAPHAPLPAPRWDFAVSVRGPLVEEIHRESQAQWLRVGHLPIVGRIHLFRELRRSRRRRASSRCAPASWCATTCATAAPSSAPTCRRSARRASGC